MSLNPHDGNIYEAGALGHRGMPCPKCHAILPFLEYGHKTGKNGKPAKWPIYEKCRNSECSLGRKNLNLPPIVEEREEEFQGKPLNLPDPKPIIALFQMTNRKVPAIFFDDMWDAIMSRKVDAKEPDEKFAIRASICMHSADINKIFEICIATGGPITAIKTEDGLKLTQGKRTIVISMTNWDVTKGYGYYTIKEKA